MSTNTSIQLKKSGVTGNTPVDLVHGEVALNYADGRLYYKDGVDGISYIYNQDSFATVNANGSLVLASSPTDILSIVPGNNISITANTVSKTIKFDTNPTLNNDEYARQIANAAFIQANAAFIQANTGGGGGGSFPYIDLGYIYDNTGPIPAVFDCGVLA
jgi:hypothetical protein